MRKKKFIQSIKVMTAGFAMAAFLAAAPLEASAAEQQTYTVTYSPGKIGEFSDGLKAKCEAAGGRVSNKTGNIKMTVPAGQRCPVVPGLGDITIKHEYEGKYVINTDSFITGALEPVTQSATYVVDYEALVDGVTYKIEFIDAQSGEEIAAPIIAQGNMEQVIPYVAETLEGYTISGENEQSMTLGKGDNTMTFTYTRNEEAVPPQTEVVETPGDTVTVTQNQGAAQTNTVTTGRTGATDQNAGAGTANQANAGANGAQQGEGQADTGENTGNANDGQDTETIEEEGVPLGQVDLDEEEETGSETSEIEEEETPLANKELKEDKAMNPVPLVVSGIVVVVGAGIILYILRHRR